MNALVVHAGPRALEHLRAKGLKPDDVRVVPGAAGGPKGLALHAMDRVLFSSWLLKSTRPIDLVGSSVGAWRLALACMKDPGEALARWAHGYVRQTYPREPGKAPSAAAVSAAFAQALHAQVGGHESDILAHPTFRLHVFTSRGRHILRREGKRLSRVSTPLGYLGAMASNLASRRALGGWLERVVFSDRRHALAVPLQDLPTARVALDVNNLQPSILASCSIPFWLKPVHDIPGGPRGPYWDGGITDYHLHLNYAAMDEGLVLYPHFQSTVIPGWLDKSLRHRHRATPWLDNVVVLSPSPDWVRASLPGGKLPDRGDFKAWGDDETGRQSAWMRALAECERLGDELARLLDRPSIEALPLR